MTALEDNPGEVISGFGGAIGLSTFCVFLATTAGGEHWFSLKSDPV